MILLQIVSRSEEKIDRIAKILLEEKLGIDLNITRNMERINFINNEKVLSAVHLLTAKTKAVLFPQIDTRLRDEFGDSIPEVYSLPIIHMDWLQAEELMSDVIEA